jgi:hypothetical protein
MDIKTIEYFKELSQLSKSISQSLLKIKKIRPYNVFLHRSFDLKLRKYNFSKQEIKLIMSNKILEREITLELKGYSQEERNDIINKLASKLKEEFGSLDDRTVLALEKARTSYLNKEVIKVRVSPNSKETKND